jgi:hypothetical protein
MNFAPDIDFHIGHIMLGQAVDPALTCREMAPESPSVVSQATDDSDARDKDTLHDSVPEFRFPWSSAQVIPRTVRGDFGGKTCEYARTTANAQRTATMPECQTCVSWQEILFFRGRRFWGTGSRIANSAAADSSGNDSDRAEWSGGEFS